MYDFNVYLILKKFIEEINTQLKQLKLLFNKEIPKTELINILFLPEMFFIAINMYSDEIITYVISFAAVNEHQFML